jgi:hypothetical protein
LNLLNLFTKSLRERRRLYLRDNTGAPPVIVTVFNRRVAMFMKESKSGDLVEVLDMVALADPFKNAVRGRFHVGEEMPEPQDFAKKDLIFPSDELLPKCWVDPNYKTA